MVKLSKEKNDLLRSRGYFHDGENSWEDMSRRVSKAIANGDNKLEKEFYRLISTQKFIPSSPTLMNANIENGGGLSSCFVIDIKDSIEGIFKALEDSAKIFQYNGGVGFDISPLRPSMALLTTSKGRAGGPVSFMQMFNQCASSMTVNNSRKSATKIDMQIWHPDIQQFIHCKDDGINLPLMNISVGISNKFMQAVEEDSNWDLIFPDYENHKDVYNEIWDGDIDKWINSGYSVKIYKTLRARDLFHEIAESAWKRGDPGISFVDSLNLRNPNKHIGKVMATNPCAEFNSIPYTSCCLGSFNLLKYVEECGTLSDALKLLDKDMLTAITFLDNVIDLNRYPIKEIEEMTKNNRSIGLGLMGLADSFYKLGIPYNSSLALIVIDNIFSFLTLSAKEQSHFLALERGVYPNHSGSKWGKFPVRNSDFTSIAPTGSISFFADVSSSIEPNFGLCYVRKTVEGKEYHITNKIFEQCLKERGLLSEEILNKVVQNHGSCQGISEIPEDIQEIFVTSRDIEWKDHIKTTAKVQKNISLSISKTINFSEEATIKDIEDAYKYAYEMKLLGITVYRDGSRDNQVLSSGSKNENNEKIPNSPRVRPDVMNGKTEKVGIGCGTLYVTINHDENGICESFINVGKAGGCPSQTEAVGRLISLCLRSGVSVDKIIKQLRGIRCHSTMRKPDLKILSCPDAIARILDKEKKIYENSNSISEEKEVLTKEKSKGKCPECDSEIANSEGCIVCWNCGYSKCG